MVLTSFVSSFSLLLSSSRELAFSILVCCLQQSSIDLIPDHTSKHLQVSLNLILGLPTGQDSGNNSLCRGALTGLLLSILQIDFNSSTLVNRLQLFSIVILREKAWLIASILRFELDQTWSSSVHGSPFSVIPMSHQN